MCLDPRGPKPPSYGQFISLHVEKTELNIKYRYRSDHLQLLKKCKLSFHIGKQLDILCDTKGNMR